MNRTPGHKSHVALTVAVLAAIVIWHGGVQDGAPTRALADAPSRFPTVLDNRLQLERLAAEPELVTPTGICFDRRGRLLVIESHTHMRPKDYVGPPADRIRRFEDTNGDGRPDRWSTFHEGLQLAMNIQQHANGSVYVVTRAALVRLTDRDGDGQAEEQTEIVQLKTPCTYPHNGLMGFAIRQDGMLLLGLGENLGEPYRMVGSDGTELHGGGEGGSIYRCQPDGSGLERIATGFWNPYGLCFDPFGRLFCAENDPDASPPCRLLHLVPGGDYGYQFRYGRSGRHPLQTWTGELPGTLGMVCGLGEAPCEIVAHRGALWVASWGDHRIERYRLVPAGASFRANREVVVQGGPEFRPVGMAVAADGSLYFSDWVAASYPVHGRGGLWRLSWRKPPGPETPFPAPGKLEQQADRQRRNPTLAGLQSSDPFVRTAAVWGWAARGGLGTIDWTALSSPAARVGMLRALRWRDDTPSKDTLTAALRDPSAEVRIDAIRWIADRGLNEYRDAILKLLDTNKTDEREYLIILAAAQWLATGQVTHGGQISDELLVGELKRQQRPLRLQALALKRLSPDNPFLTPKQIGTYLKSPNATLRLEAVRTLGQQTSPDRFAPLAQVAGDSGQTSIVRAEAIMALGAAAHPYQALLEQLASDAIPAIAREASRTLRLAGIQTASTERKHTPNTPAAQAIDAWLKLVDTPGDAESGRRLFFSPIGPRCAICHRLEGRGGRIGPDLTRIGQTTSRRRILTSILQPSAEMAPQYVPWAIQTDDGKLRIGMAYPRHGPPGQTYFYDQNGQRFTLRTETIEAQMPSKTSLMPAGLEKQLTADDLRDLLALLASAPSSPAAP